MRKAKPIARIRGGSKSILNIRPRYFFLIAIGKQHKGPVEKMADLHHKSLKIKIMQFKVSC